MDDLRNDALGGSCGSQQVRCAVAGGECRSDRYRGNEAVHGDFFSFADFCAWMLSWQMVIDRRGG
jgi:hypothetical protein